ncbi:hypothetical protein BDV25DRAFT_146515 [Aspergillus avenaceus]|uniref:Uncharacterized protein n=1 Tax=Aspergillus avenaceus TaxID=36643 RepID=A0A5N6U9Q8_ASPAV|nr:hypothetical protein BDV25DRAFT_146515 [Aspergillus avenaceus]
MHFQVSTVAAALALFSLTTALPTTPTSLLTRDDTQCETGKAYYVCNLNDFRGCCSVDPCALEDGCPDQNNDEPTCKDGKAKLFQPQMQTIIEGADPISTPNFNVSNTADTKWEQTMTFKLPADAKSCSINWAVPADRNFQAGQNAVVRAYQDGKSIGSGDFTGWPDVEGPHSHTVGPAECKETLELRLALDKESHVFLEQGAETGWYVQYDC